MDVRTSNQREGIIFVEINMTGFITRITKDVPKHDKAVEGLPSIMLFFLYGTLA